MRFTKLHGCGNDYLFVDCVHEPVPADPPALSRAISDRHFGVGSDGLILACPSDSADVRMRMFNADGSEAEMCGNGIRCLAKFAFERGLARNNPMTVETGRGVLTVRLDVDANQVRQVTVDMGEPILEAAKIPVELSGVAATQQVLDVPLDGHVTFKPPTQWIELCALDRRMTCVSMGNPHVVIYCGNVDAVPLSLVGPFLECHVMFPRRINVHFVEVQSRQSVKMRTWERGSGITLACGTGACAVAVASALTGRTARTIRAHLPGGDLELDWAADDHVYMTGPAVEVFSADWRGVAGER